MQSKSNTIGNLINEVENTQSLTSILYVALQQYANEPKNIDINSILDTVKLIDQKLSQATEKFERSSNGS